MAEQTYFELNNGVKMPALGLGVFQMSDEEVREAVPAAVDAGYRLIDTASRYYNEKALGAALAELDVPREDIFITTKLWFKDHGYESTKKAFEVSLENLGLEYLDLYLIHQPFNDYYGAWRAMEELYDEGKIRAIGVSNFYPDRFYDLAQFTKVAPAINQRRINPYDQQADIRELSAKYGTTLQAWSPLGQGNPALFEDAILTGIAGKYGKSVPQVILRWLVQTGVSAVVKSVHAHRLQENLNIWDFELSSDEVAAINAIDKRETGNGGPDHRDPQMLDLLMTFE